jgi:hypothetical protein
VVKKIIFFLFLWLGSTSDLQAADLQSTYLRLDRNKTGLSPGKVLVVTKTTSSATEDGVRITVGTGWTINTNASAFSVSTINLPEGVSAWPGIDTAVAVNGQAITFPGVDLAPGEFYGFYITGGIGVNGQVSSSNYVWEVATLSGGLADGTIEVGVPVVAADSITVTGTVPANPSDYPVSISSDLTGNASQNQTLNYQIDYGSLSAAITKPLTIKAEWSRGTLENFPIPTLDILDYVIGSGTSAYNGVEPVIDLIDRTITWTIPDFPTNTLGQTVSFSLQTNDQYTGSSLVNFDVSVTVTAGNITVATDTINQYYQYNPPYLSPTPTPTSIPTPTSVSTPAPTSTSTPAITLAPGIPTATSAPAATSTPVQGPTPTPKPFREKLKIEKVEIINLSSNEAGIRVATNIPLDKLILTYGLTPKKITQKIIFLKPDNFEIFLLTNLNPQNLYYFRLEAQADTDRLFSDIFTFKTPAVSDLPEVVKSTLLANSDGKVLYDAARIDKEINDYLVIIPKAVEYSIQFQVDKHDLVKQATLILKSRQVLGISSAYGAEPASSLTDLIEIRPGWFMGRLLSPSEVSFYEMSVRLSGINGTIIENKLADMEIIEPMRILELESLAPIESAKVEISLYNSKEKRFLIIPPNTLLSENPVFSETDGEVALVLPRGKYRAKVTALGYSEKQTEFEISAGGDLKLPSIYLEKDKFNLLVVGRYYSGTFTDVWQYCKNNLKYLFSSGRFFNLVALINLILLVINTTIFYRNSLKTNIFGGKNRDDYIDGKINVSGADIILIDAEASRILAKTKSNWLGRFRFKLKPAKRYKLSASKSGYETSPFFEYVGDEGILAGDIKINLKRSEDKQKLKYILNEWFYWEISDLSTGVLNISVLLVEILFINKFGWSATAIWILIGILNLILWLVYTYRNGNKVVAKP